MSGKWFRRRTCSFPPAPQAAQAMLAIWGNLRSRAGYSALDVVVAKDAQRRTVEVVVLAAAERPQEGCEAQQAEPKRCRHQIDEDAHGVLHRAWMNLGVAEDISASALTCRRSRPRIAFAVTISDEPDIASAAISGVTRPSTAIGTATAL